MVTVKKKLIKFITLQMIDRDDSLKHCHGAFGNVLGSIGSNLYCSPDTSHFAD